jgi:hypothetical protein
MTPPVGLDERQVSERLRRHHVDWKTPVFDRISVQRAEALRANDAAGPETLVLLLLQADLPASGDLISGMIREGGRRIGRHNRMADTSIRLSSQTWIELHDNHFYKCNDISVSHID